MATAPKTIKNVWKAYSLSGPSRKNGTAPRTGCAFSPGSAASKSYQSLWNKFNKSYAPLAIDATVRQEFNVNVRGYAGNRKEVSDQDLLAPRQCTKVRQGF